MKYSSIVIKIGLEMTRINMHDINSVWHVLSHMQPKTFYHKSPNQWIAQGYARWYKRDNKISQNKPPRPPASVREACTDRLNVSDRTTRQAESDIIIFRITGPLWGQFTCDRWRPVTRNLDIFFDLRLNKRLSKPSRHRWFETPSRSLCRHCNYATRCKGTPQIRKYRGTTVKKEIMDPTYGVCYLWSRYISWHGILNRGTFTI